VGLFENRLRLGQHISASNKHKRTGYIHVCDEEAEYLLILSFSTLRIIPSVLREVKPSTVEVNLSLGLTKHHTMKKCPVLNQAPHHDKISCA